MAVPTVPVNSVDLGSRSQPALALEMLDPALDGTGSIKNPQEVPKVVKFMKESNLLVNRCVVLNVIKATESPGTIARFMDGGGWAMLNVWLSDAKKSQNNALLIELLEVLQKLPVGIEALKQGNMGKLVKQLSKLEDPEVQKRATELLAKWMAVFREGQSAKGKVGEERRSSATEDSAAKAVSSKKEKKKKKEGGKGGKGDGGPPPESMQPPPGPLVALGRPKDRANKRPRELLVSHPPPEKKAKNSPLIEGKGDGKAENKAGKVFVESEGFMNALSTQAAKMKEKKIKKVPKISKLTRTLSSSDSLPDSKPEQATPTTEGPEGGSESMEGVEASESDPGPKKKRVSWAGEDSLTKIHYFELDESERVNVNRPTSFLDAAQQEKMREREALASGLMFSRDRLIEMISWRRPYPLEVLGDLVVRGGESKEKDVQAEREGKVLAQLFLSKASVQPSPLEPDPDSDLVEAEPKLIPLLEPNSAGSNQNPPPPGPGPGLVFGSPTHMPPGASGPLTPGSPLPSPATTINQAQSLINYFQEHGTNPSPLPGPGGRGGRGRGAVGGRGVPNGGQSAAPSYRGGHDSNHYPPSRQGFPPPQQGDGPSSGGPPGGAGHWSGGSDGGGGFYGGEGHFRGQSDPSMRRGRGFGPPRGRGRGFMPPWRRGLESKICKHFITHGCKLGSRCRFLHCTLEELANNMASNEQGFSRPPRGRGGRYDAGPPSQHTLNGAESDMNKNSNSPPIHNSASSREEHTQDIDTQAS